MESAPRGCAAPQQPSRAAPANPGSSAPKLAEDTITFPSGFSSVNDEVDRSHRTGGHGCWACLIGEGSSAAPRVAADTTPKLLEVAYGFAWIAARACHSVSNVSKCQDRGIAPAQPCGRCWYAVRLSGGVNALFILSPRIVARNIVVITYRAKSNEGRVEKACVPDLCNCTINWSTCVVEEVKCVGRDILGPVFIRGDLAGKKGKAEISGIIGVGWSF